MKTLLLLLLITQATLAAPISYAVRLSGNWSELEIWNSNRSGQYQHATTLPTKDSIAILNKECILNLDIDTQVQTFRVIGTNGNKATFNINTHNVLNTETAMIGTLKGTGSAVVNLNTGAFDISKEIQFFKDGKIAINGGILGSVAPEEKRVLKGPGVIELNKGRIYYNHPTNDGMIHISIQSIHIKNGLFESTNTVLGHTNKNTRPVTIEIIGDASTIHLKSLNTYATAHSGEFKFVLNEQGVSPVNIENGLDAENLKLHIDATQLTNKPETITLFKTGKLKAPFKKSNISVLGLGEQGSDWRLAQNSNSITLEIL